MRTLRLVELDNGQFAIQQRQGLFIKSWAWCSAREHYLWTSESSIRRYCFVNTLEDAEKALVKICEEIRMRTQKLPKISRIIKQVRV